MATTFYPRSSASLATVPASVFAPDAKKELLLTRGAAAVTQTDNTIAALTALAQCWGSNVGNGDGFQHGLLFISNPLNAVTISGTITHNIRALESSTKANYGTHMLLWQIDGAGTTSNQFANSSTTVELGTAETAFNSTSTPISTSFSAGDRLVVALRWAAGSGAGTTASGLTVSGFYNGPTAAASGDTFVTFTETITEQIAPPDLAMGLRVT